MFVTFATNFIITFAIYLLGIGSKKAFEIYHNILPAKRVWKLPKMPKVNVITANTPHETRIDEKEYALTGYVSEYMAADSITSCIEKLYKNVSVQIDMEHFFDYRNITNNMIIIGGPVNNPLSKKLFADMDFPYSFEGFTIVNKHNQTRYTPVINQYIEKDYAYVANFQNPYNEENRILLFAGCRSLGCYAGAKALSKHYQNPLLQNFLKTNEDKNYAFIVETNGHTYSAIGNPKIIEFQSF